MPWPCGAGTTGPRFMGLRYPTWMPTGRWSWTISCRAGSKRGQFSGSCTPSILQMRECTRRSPPSKGGVRTNNLTHVSINNQNACQRKGSNSAAIGALGVAVFRRQMQQIGCLVLLFHLGELFHQSPGVLRRHFPIVLPFDARQFSRRHQGDTWVFNLRNVISMWPLRPSDVT